MQLISLQLNFRVTGECQQVHLRSCNGPACWDVSAEFLRLQQPPALCPSPTAMSRHGALGVPLEGCVRKHHVAQQPRVSTTAFMQQLQAEASSIAASARELQVKHAKAELRHAVVLDLLRASRLIVAILDSISKAGSSLADALEAASGLEGTTLLVSQCLEADAAGLQDDGGLEPFIPAAPVLGSTPALLQSFINPAKLEGPASSSLLLGTPLGVQHALLIAMLADPAHVQTAVAMQRPGFASSWVLAEREAMYSLVQAAVEELQAAGPSPEERQGPLTRLAVCIMTASVYGVAGALLFPAGNIKTLARMPLPGQQTLLSEAQLDSLIEEVAPSQEQLQAIMQLHEVFHELQAPLAKRKAALMARAAQLLATDTGGSPGQAAQPRSHPAAASQAAAKPPGGNGAVAAVLALQSPAAAAAAAVFPLGGGSYYELQSVMQQVEAVQRQLFWYDICCSNASMGQLNFQQIGRCVLGFRPYSPLTGSFIRRIVARNSLPLLRLPLWPTGQPGTRQQLRRSQQQQQEPQEQSPPPQQQQEQLRRPHCRERQHQQQHQQQLRRRGEEQQQQEHEQHQHQQQQQQRGPRAEAVPQYRSTAGNQAAPAAWSSQFVAAAVAAAVIESGSGSEPGEQQQQQQQQLSCLLQELHQQWSRGCA